MEFVPNEKATPIRYPSTANLMIDSRDRNSGLFNPPLYPNCNNFLISKSQSIMNGFFTRVGTTEVVFEWNTPNVNNESGMFTYVVNGVTNQFILLDGFYNGQELCEAIVERCNFFTSSPPIGNATGVTWSLEHMEGGGAVFKLVGMDVPNGASWSLASPILAKLTGGTSAIADIFELTESFYDIPSYNADLRPTRFIDIVCAQLTNNQAVKDGSTALNPRDVLCRWYFDYDNPTPTDAYGFPILMGYAPFYVRRIFNPPKQIQWQTNVPIGQMSFQLYDDRGYLAEIDDRTNYLMTLQASEV